MQTNSTIFQLSERQKELLKKIRDAALTKEEIVELTKIANFIISKRKKEEPTK